MVRRVVVSAVRVVAVAAAVEEAGDGLAVAARVRAALVREAPEPLVDERRALREAPGALEAREVGLGSTRVIQRRFNVSVSRARVTETTSTLRGRSER